MDDEAPPGGDGLSWNTAYRFLQDALYEAASLGGAITEIRVGQGEYKPDRCEVQPDGSGDREAVFLLTDGLLLAGGYAGLAAGPGENPNQRDPTGFPSVLNGDLGDDDPPDDSASPINRGDNSYRLLRAAGVGPGTAIEGLVVRAGHADGGPWLAEGGGLEVEKSTMSISDCVFLGNTDVNGDGESSQIDATSGSEVSLSYCCVQGLTGTLGGSGNIGDDPLFVDLSEGDAHLLSRSPCIDAGDNSAVAEQVTTDLDGNPRFLDVPETADTGNGTAPVVEMGAYESLGGGCLALTNQETICYPDGTTFTLNVEGVSACTGDTVMATFTASGGAVGEDFCFTVMVNDDQGGFCCSTQVCVPVPDCSEALADLDGDGVVGVLDLILLLGQFGPCNSGCSADMDHDGTVGVTDLLILLDNWD